MEKETRKISRGQTVKGLEMACSEGWRLFYWKQGAKKSSWFFFWSLKWGDNMLNSVF